MNENGNLSTKLPVFDGKNWNRWMIQMRVLFEAQNVLDLVNDGYAALPENATPGDRARSLRAPFLFSPFFLFQPFVFLSVFNLFVSFGVWNPCGGYGSKVTVNTYG